LKHSQRERSNERGKRRRTRLNLARKSVIVSTSVVVLIGTFRLRWNARDFARFATRVTGVTSCATHFRCLQAVIRDGRACVCAELWSRETRVFSSLPSTWKGSGSYSERRFAKFNGWSSNKLVLSDILIAVSPPPSVPVSFPCVVRARGRARADPRCATRYLCSTDHRRLQASYTRHPRHPRHIGGRNGGNNHPPSFPQHPRGRQRRCRRRAARVRRRERGASEKGAIPIGNGSAIAATAMDQKRVYKLVLTGGT